MAFKLRKITGNDLPQAAFTNEAVIEAVIHSLIAYNTTSNEVVIKVLLSSVVVLVEAIPPNGTFRLTDKINVEASVMVEVDAPSGVNVTLSYLQQLIDSAAELTLTQQVVVDATEQAELAAISASEAETSNAATLVNKNAAAQSVIDAANNAEIAISHTATINTNTIFAMAGMVL
jgi:hypothetical protein